MQPKKTPTTDMAEQLAFALPSKPALGREDFFVSPSNSVAVAMLETVEGWPNGKLLLIGPRGAGKTHLAHVWAAQVQAKIVKAAALRTADIDSLAACPLAVEDADQIAGDTEAETSLFHLHNRMAERTLPLLLTAQQPPRFWGLGLADLASRMEATSAVTIELPDDRLLSAVLLKLFSDRQLTPASTVITYLARNMERSFALAGTIVDAMDTEALSSGRAINRGLAVDILDKISSDRA